MSLYIVALITFLYTTLPATESLQNCSALRAFVEVQATTLTRQTLTTAQALFPPFRYPPIPWTSLVTISNDNMCDENTTLSTNITNKIVLLFETPNCTAHYQVLIAQYNGARAVLMSNNDLTGTVVNIPKDNDLSDFNVSIPLRSISLLDAQVLTDQLLAGSDIQAQIGCFDTTYPTVICLRESSADSDYRHMAGNFQRQEGRFVNDHPIWIAPGWPKLRQDFHIFLHDARGKDDWYWAVTDDVTFTYDSSIKFRCAVGGVSTPTACPKWNMTDNYGYTYEYLPTLNLSDGLCPVLHQDLCLDSFQHTLAGLRGTYTRQNPDDPIWFRDLNQCNFRTGLVLYVDDGYYGKGYFVLHEPLNGWQIALCIIPRNKSENGTFATAKWRPDLCHEWKARNDDDLRYSAQHREYDPTLNVSIGECSAARTAVHQTPCVESDPPDVICLANNSILHSSVMGEYERLNETGTHFDSPIYQRIEYDDPLHPNGTDPLYIWYSNEVWAEVYDVGDHISYRRWVVTRTPLQDAIKAKSYAVYGHCEGWAHGNPMACQGWAFFADEVYHYDERMTISDGECSVDPIVTIPETWPQYICIGFVNGSIPWAHEWSKLHRDQLIGAYVLETSNETVPMWKKVYNDYYSSSSMWIYYDAVSTIWHIATAKKDVMYCDSGNAASIYPMDCPKWYDDEWEILDNIYLYNCTADDVLTASPTADPTPQPTQSPSDHPKICMRRDGEISSFLEGVFVSDGVIDEEYGTVQYILENPNIDEAIYMWYHEDRWWLSPVDYRRYGVTYGAMVYGWCRGGEQGVYPVCEDCWQMNWELTLMSDITTHTFEVIEDCSLVVTGNLGDCLRQLEGSDVYVSKAFVGRTDEWPDSLCINTVNEKHKDHGEDHEYDHDHSEDHPYLKLNDLPQPSAEIKGYLGKYELNFLNNGLAEYASRKQNDVYIKHDRITNRWLVVDGFGALMTCYDGDGNTLGPCYVYDWELEQSMPVDNVLSISDTCNSKKEPVDSTGAVVGTVILILLVICVCCVIVYVVYKRNNETTQKYVGADTEIVDVKGDKETKRMNEDTTTKGQDGYDMTALNPEDNDPLTEEQDADDNDEQDAEDPLTEE